VVAEYVFEKGEYESGCINTVALGYPERLFEHLSNYSTIGSLDELNQRTNFATHLHIPFRRSRTCEVLSFGCNKIR
jgi:hypothetical protein